MSQLAVRFDDLADQMGTRYDRLLEYARREDDPLPVRLMPGRSRGGFVLPSEFDEWVRRNCPLYRDRRK